MREFYCGEEQIYIDTLVLKVSRPAKHITFQKKKKNKIEKRFHWFIFTLAAIRNNMKT